MPYVVPKKSLDKQISELLEDGASPSEIREQLACEIAEDQWQAVSRVPLLRDIHPYGLMGARQWIDMKGEIDSLFRSTFTQNQLLALYQILSSFQKDTKQDEIRWTITGHFKGPINVKGSSFVDPTCDYAKAMACNMAVYRAFGDSYNNEADITRLTIVTAIFERMINLGWEETRCRDFLNINRPELIRHLSTVKDGAKVERLLESPDYPDSGIVSPALKHIVARQQQLEELKVPGVTGVVYGANTQRTQHDEIRTQIAEAKLLACR